MAYLLRTTAVASGACKLKVRHRPTALIGAQRLTSSAELLPLVTPGLCRNVAHNLDQLATVDLIEETVELDVLRHGRALAKQLNVILD